MRSSDSMAHSTSLARSWTFPTIGSSWLVGLRTSHARNHSTLSSRWCKTRHQAAMTWCPEQTCFFLEQLLDASSTRTIPRSSCAGGLSMKMRLPSNAKDTSLSRMCGSVSLTLMSLSSRKVSASLTTVAPFTHSEGFWRQVRCSTSQLRRLSHLARARTLGRFLMSNFPMPLLILGPLRSAPAKSSSLVASMRAPWTRWWPSKSRLGRLKEIS